MRLSVNETRKKDLTCSQCLFTCAEKKEMSRHVRNSHESTVSEVGDQGMAPAPNERVRAMPTGEGPFVCGTGTCSKVYQRIGFLRRHLQQLHGVELLMAAPAVASGGNVGEVEAAGINNDLAPSERGSEGGTLPSDGQIRKYSPSESLTECPFGGCHYRPRGTNGGTYKAYQNHCTKVHDWNLAGGKPKRTRMGKTTAAGPKGAQNPIPVDTGSATTGPRKAGSAGVGGPRDSDFGPLRLSTRAGKRRPATKGGGI